MEIMSSPLKLLKYSLGGYEYICESGPGAIPTASVWLITRIDVNGNIAHAGTSASSCGKFDQVATNASIVAALGYF